MGICDACCSSAGSAVQDTDLEAMITDRGIDKDTATSFEFETTQSFGLDEQLIKKFHDAIGIGNELTVKRCLKSNPDIANSKYNENTALHVAVENNQYKIMQYLFHHHASLNTQNVKSGDTPLHIAVRNDDLKAIKILCKHNPDKTIENVNGETVISIALKNNTKHKVDIITRLYSLEQWLERKDLSPPHSWTKTWVVVKHNCMLWNNKQRMVGSKAIDKKEKTKWDMCTNLLNIESVESSQGKRGKKFTVRVNGKNHLFRVKNKEIRDCWVMGLNHYIQRAKNPPLSV